MRGVLPSSYFDFLCFTGTIVSKDISWTFLHADFFAFRPVFNALLLINDHHILFHTNRLSRAHLNAHLAGNAPSFAQSFHLFPRILGAARDPNPGISGNELNNFFRAGAHTCTAAHAGCRIDHREIIHHSDGIEGASLRTLAEAYTGVSATHGTTEGKIRPCAGTMSHIGVFFLDFPLYARASNSRDKIGNGRHFLARYLSHFLSHFRFPRETEIGWNVGLVDDRFSIGFASSVATTPSLGSSQNLFDFFYLGVDLHGKFVGG